jgi:hypothetical protein
VTTQCPRGWVETLRHLVFAVDVWVSRMLLGEQMPYHRFGLPPTDYPAANAPELGIGLAARPPRAEVLSMHADSSARVRPGVEALTDGELERVRIF